MPHTACLPLLKWSVVCLMQALQTEHRHTSEARRRAEQEAAHLREEADAAAHSMQDSSSALQGHMQRMGALQRQLGTQVGSTL